MRGDFFPFIKVSTTGSRHIISDIQVPHTARPTLNQLIMYFPALLVQASLSERQPHRLYLAVFTLVLQRQSQTTRF